MWLHWYVEQRKLTMEIPETTATDLTRRLRRVEGQLRGIRQMLAERYAVEDVEKMFMKLV